MPCATTDVRMTASVIDSNCLASGSAMPPHHQIPKMLLQGIAVGFNQRHRISHRHVPMLSGKLHNLQLQLRQRGQHDFFTFYFFSSLRTCSDSDRK